MNGKRSVAVLLVLALSFSILVSLVSAHSPLGPSDNESLSSATEIFDPTKSWAIYAELHEGEEAQYCRFNITIEQKIHVMLYKSTDQENVGFLPGFVLMGPQIADQGEVPDFVETPESVGKLVVEGKMPSQADYEPFSPGTLYSLAEISLSAPASGTYYIAVYEKSRGGHYGLAVGDRESYTLEEWVLIPLSLLSVYQWEGQSISAIFTPMIVTVGIGMGFLIWRNRRVKSPRTAFGWLGSLAGLLLMGTGTITLYQMFYSIFRSSLVPEVVVTLIFALIPILLGIGTIVFSIRGDKVQRRKYRVYVAVLGIVALFVWAGLYAGPAIAVITSLLPWQRASKSV